MPERIQRQRTKGWTMPEGAVYVGRPTRWGNPWRVIPARDSWYPWSDAADVIHAETGNSVGRFGRDCSTPGTGAAYWAVQAYRMDLTEELRAAARDELRGKDLACWCSPGTPCHADVLLEIANAEAVSDAP